MSRIFRAERRTRTVTGVIFVLAFLANEGFGTCLYPAFIDASINTSVSTSAAEARGLGSASVKNLAGEICYFMYISASAVVKENGNEIGSYNSPGGVLGELANIVVVGPASVGNCYNSFITASSMALPVGTNQGGEQCWSGPPPPPPPPDDSQPCPEGGCPGSPIILNLGTDNYRLTSTQEGVQFDLRNEGVRRQVSWTARGVDNAFLAIDRDFNGQIDSGAELFGDYTHLKSGARASHGFEALAEFDENGDHLIDSRDSVWRALLLWTDRNHDGGTTADELQHLADTPVVSLELAHHMIGRRDQWGNLFRYTAKLSIRVGQQVHQRHYFDIFLRVAL